MQKREELLLSRLNQVQDKEGFISEEAMKGISEETGIPIMRIYEVATFYSMLTH